MKAAAILAIILAGSLAFFFLTATDGPGPTEGADFPQGFFSKVVNEGGASYAFNLELSSNTYDYSLEGAVYFSPDGRERLEAILKDDRQEFRRLGIYFSPDDYLIYSLQDSSWYAEGILPSFLNNGTVRRIINSGALSNEFGSLLFSRGAELEQTSLAISHLMSSLSKEESSKCGEGICSNWYARYLENEISLLCDSDGFCYSATLKTADSTFTLKKTAPLYGPQDAKLFELPG